MSRKIAREQILKFLFSLDFNKDQNPELLVEEFITNDDDALDDPDGGHIFHDELLSDKDKSFCVEIIKGVLERLSFIDDLIEGNSIGWKKGRIAKVDLAILRLSVYEILFRDDIPESVSANEAIELAKKYSSEESSKFINGILGNIIRNKTQKA